ncbi:MAG: phage tail protein, partial [Symploca sp. SIO1A3]|nr:phage tail protein [Symploca sp. SIO1A3]
MSEPFIAEIKIFAGAYAIRGWAFCNGAELQLSQNEALFSLIGTTFGGDGRNTFALPNLQGRVPIGVGQGPGLKDYRWGQKDGTETETLTSANMPNHTHQAIAVTVPPSSGGYNDDPAKAKECSAG